MLISNGGDWTAGLSKANLNSFLLPVSGLPSEAGWSIHLWDQNGSGGLGSMLENRLALFRGMIGVEVSSLGEGSVGRALS